MNKVVTLASTHLEFGKKKEEEDQQGKGMKWIAVKLEFTTLS